MGIRPDSSFKKCPRCKIKCFAHAKKCHECDLLFDRLNYTSNKTAKKNLLHGKRNEVIMMTTWPYDAKKSTALWLSGLLGFTGAHNFYLGRFWKGALVLFGLLLALTMVILSDLGFPTNSGIYYYIRIIGLIPGSSVLIFWFSDFISIFLERYKIPVSIDERLCDLKTEVLEEVNSKNLEKINKNRQKNKKKVKK